MRLSYNGVKIPPVIRSLKPGMEESSQVCRVSVILMIFLRTHKVIWEVSDVAISACTMSKVVTFQDSVVVLPVLSDGMRSARAVGEDTSTSLPSPTLVEYVYASPLQNTFAERESVYCICHR